ncbi:hypothetical protein K469DRAFT_682652 [Zopfia rhizophila CBS 207.26]|uniref:Uncharacterized protein n=1 Tax=Zopfia rhizophila CBS 207.26 TaxID=1314779 RepID=A0A6A6DCS6_9PEZI|nr:hypothetical protein K469DRAFT_682652 [Zopfia rhizophila CBS 207.26]
MNSETFAERLEFFYAYIGNERKTILLIGNFSAHELGVEIAPPADIRIVFLPKNPTSSTVIKGKAGKQEQAEDITPLFIRALEIGRIEEAREISRFLNPVDEDLKVKERDANLKENFQHYTDQIGEEFVDKKDDKVVHEPIPSTEQALKAVHLLERYYIQEKRQQRKELRIW